MTITSSDIKLMQSERMNDDADGGGFMTASVVQDNIENNVFPDISSLDRVQGAIDFRKIYAAVLTANNDVYYGSHVVFDQMAADAAVAGLMAVAASFGEDRSTFINSLYTSYKFFGIKKLLTALTAGQQVVNVGSLTSRFIPSTTVGTSTSGTVNIGSGTHSSCLFPIGSPIAFEVSAATVSGVDYNVLMARLRAIPTSVAGNVTDAVGTAALGVGVTNGYPYLQIAGVNTNIPFLGQAYYWRLNGANPAVASSTTGTYQPALFVDNLPAEEYSYTYTSAMTPVQSIVLPNASERGSEYIYWTDELGRECRMSSAGNDSFFQDVDLSGAFAANATINRGTNTITGLLSPSPKVGTKIRVVYVRSGYIQEIPFASLSGSGTLSSGEVTITLASNYKFSNAFFQLGSNRYVVNTAGEIRLANPNKANRNPQEPSTIVGFYDSTAQKLQMPGFTGTISNWFGVQVSTLFPLPLTYVGSITPNLSPVSLTLSGTKVTGGGAWTATTDVNGTVSGSIVSGSYDKSTGALTLTFTESVTQAISWAGTILAYTMVGSGVTGVDPSHFPTNGEVPVFRVSDVVVVHNTQSIAPATAVVGVDVTAPRAPVSEMRVFGNDGFEITTGFTVDKTLAKVSFSNVSGYSQPVTITHRVEDVATIIAATANGLVTLSRPLTFDYPTSGAGSYLSSALVLGDLQARAHLGFQQATWTGVFSDVIIGSGITADYNEASYPITCTNQGAIKERWALVFTNTTQFNVYGEQVGLIATGNTATTCAPLNPATGTPYFSLNPAGWGSGWATGNVYRFNTEAAASGLWAIRSINPSDPFVGQDKFTFAVRGDINA